MNQTVWDEAFQEAVSQPELPEPLSNDLITLLELGKLEEVVHIGNRTIQLRTLTIGEELELGLLTKEFHGTSEQLRAEITAAVAASIIAVDGMPLITSLGPNEETLRQRFDYVRKNFYWPVIRLIYQKYSELLERSEEALRELEEKKD